MRQDHRNTGYLAGSKHLWIPTDESGLVAWYRSYVGVTYDGSNKVSQIDDKSGNGRHITQGTADSQPLRIANGLNGRDVIEFDGVDDYLRSSSFTFDQPATWYLLFRQESWQTGFRRVFEGYTTGNGLFQSNDTSAELGIYAGTILGYRSVSLGAWAVAECIFDGASSKFRLNRGSELSGNAGSTNAGGITVGREVGFDNTQCHMRFCELIARSVSDDSTMRTKHVDYLASVAALSI